MVVNRTDALPMWLFVTTIVMFIVRLSVAYHDKLNPLVMPQRITWRTYKDAKPEVLKERKPAALFFVHEKKCQKCQELERILQQEDLAKEFQKNYIPIRIPIEQSTSDMTDTDAPPKEGEALKRSYGVYRIPELVLVPNEMWDVPLDSSDYYRLPDLRVTIFNQTSANEVENLLSKSVDWHPDVMHFGEVKWLKPDVALKQATDSKPALLFFGRSLDRHSDLMRSKIFGDPEINKVIKQNFLPVFIISQERKNLPDSEETKKLITKFRIKSFPTIVVSSPSKPSQMMTGFAGKAETIDFLSQAREK